MISKRGDLHFVVTQHTNDLQVLNIIQSILGFGKVIPQSSGLNTKSRTSRYVVQDIRHLYLIILLLNGNIILPSRKKVMYNFLLAYNARIKKINRNTKYITSIDYRDLNIKPTLNDHWLMGFTEAEGCFHISSTQLSRVMFIVSQKWEMNLPILSEFILLFKTGRIVPHSVNNNYGYIIQGAWECTNIYTYFDKVPFRSLKKESYLLWKDLNKRVINKEHLSSESSVKIEMVALAKKINSRNRKSR